MTAYGEVEKLLSDTIGFDPEVMGRKVIESEIDSLVKALQVDNVGFYVKELMSGGEELGRLIERIVVPETWFFRDRECFRFLTRYAKEACAGRGGITRVLSAPCSTGEEPYSIALTLIDAGLEPEMFHIDAVDISSTALRVAAAARYGRSSFRGGTTKRFEDRYFIPVEDKMQLKPQIAGLVNFSRDNILRRGFSTDRGPYRMIFCKNLLIYLNPAARQRLFACLDRLLLPEGILFTGHSELASFLQYGFEPVAHSRSFACIKRDARSPKMTHAGTDRPKVAVSAPVHIPLQDKRKDGTVTERSDAPRGDAVPARHGAVPKSGLEAVRNMADRGSLGEASDLCEQYLKEHGTDKEGYCLMGLISQALKRLDRAEGFFLKALYLDPVYYEALLHMSLLCDEKGDDGRAEIFRQRIRRLDEADSNGGGGRP